MYPLQRLSRTLATIRQQLAEMVVLEGFEKVDGKYRLLYDAQPTAGSGRVVQSGYFDALITTNNLIRPNGSIVTPPTKTAPVAGDNLLWREAPGVRRDHSMADEEGDLQGEGIYPSPGFTVSPFIKVVPGQPVTANYEIYTGNWYAEATPESWLGFWPIHATNRQVVPPGANYLRVALSTVLYDDLYLFLGDFGPEPINRALPWPEYWDIANAA